MGGCPLRNWVRAALRACVQVRTQEAASSRSFAWRTTEALRAGAELDWAVLRPGHAVGFAVTGNGQRGGTRMWWGQWSPDMGEVLLADPWDVE